MKWVVLAAGRLKERGLRDAADDYLRRIRRHVRCDEIEAKDDPALVRSVPDEAWLVALDVTGNSYTSVAFSAELEQWSRRNKGVVAFAIGGAEGLPAELLRRADVRLSLSSMTLPHRLARLILLEQLYRGISILRNEPYAREG